MASRAHGRTVREPLAIAALGLVQSAPLSGWHDTRSSTHIRDFIRAQSRGLSHRGVMNLARRKDVYTRLRLELEHLRDRQADVGIRTYNAALSFVGKGGNLVFAAELGREMQRQSIELDSCTLHELLKCCAVSGRVKSAAVIMKQLRLRGVQPTALTYNLVLQLFARREDRDNLHKVLDSMQRDGIRPDAHSLCISLRACRDLKEGRDMWELIKKRVFRNGTHFEVGTPHYKALIQCCHRGKDAKGAKVVFEELLKTGAKPDKTCWAALASAIASTGDVEGVQKVLADACEAGVELDGVAWGTLIEACAEAAEHPGDEYVDLAENVFARCSVEGHLSGSVYTKLFSVYAKAGAVKKAEALREHFASTAMQGESYSMVHFIKQAYLKAGDTEGAASVQPRVGRGSSVSTLPAAELEGRHTHAELTGRGHTGNKLKWDQPGRGLVLPPLSG
eukprot:Hpha_TRINITY_DN33454_c0_g1::TRINITY_DN33454_c0_g1_i1::g.818::m.818